ncbi:G protein-coupled glucose receptor regulating Gpa2-domain-containing protein [Halenospora varia]|nr:G protein-coupled glucose receptor regulating Gpa2-domain-containing protein [Halenospora varia]
MAPFSPSVNKIQLDMRGLSQNVTGITPAVTPHEGYILQCIALTFATISVASSILAFYWFVKMRRTFRHDLIMLLIQSDMFKALWFMMYPIVVFSRGPVPNNSTFCQVNGFFLSLGIEASDFAVLQIAIHTALYIFKPKATLGEGGLYPYRYIAYVGWIVFPLLTASLAFINDNNSYVSEGTYCYLPVRPFWYRLALGWIPRYIIFIVILFIYASIYYYVRYKFHGFNRAGIRSGTNCSSDSAEAARRPPKRHSLPPSPRLHCHGLIPEPRQGSTNEGDPFKLGLSSMDSYRNGEGSLDGKSVPGAHRFMLSSFILKNNTITIPCSSPTARASPTGSNPELSTQDTMLQYSASLPASPRAMEAAVLHPATSRAPTWRDGSRRFSPTISGRPSLMDIFSILKRHPDGSIPQTPLSQLQLVNSRGQNLVDVEMLRTRDKIRRQLRFLFIYPLVYIGMWVVPFVSHVLQYDDRFASDPPFGLSCAVTIFMCSQAAVDCWLFSTREKPWRHIPGSDGTFLGSLKFWQGWDGVGERRVIIHGPGKTREEMVREARAAYRRRDEELAQRRTQNAVEGCDGRPGSGARRGERDWWDREGGDGRSDFPQMSPVAEEISNPIEDIIISDDERGSDNETALKHFKTVVFHDSSEAAAAPTKLVSFESGTAVSST